MNERSNKTSLDAGRDQESPATPVEGLLRSAADWEPDAAPTQGLAFRAIERWEQQQQRRPFLLPRFTTAFAGSLGMITACVAAGVTVLVMRPMEEVSVETVAPVSVVRPETNKTMTENVPAPRRPASSPSLAAAAVTVAQPVNKEITPRPTLAAVASNTRREARRRSNTWSGRVAQSRRSGIASRSVSPRIARANTGKALSSRPQAEVSLKPTTVALAPSKDSKSVMPPDALALDAQPVVLPVVYAEPSEDGTEIRMTPAVVALADSNYLAID